MQLHNSTALRPVPTSSLPALPPALHLPSARRDRMAIGAPGVGEFSAGFFRMAWWLRGQEGSGLRSFLAALALINAGLWSMVRARTGRRLGETAGEWEQRCGPLEDLILCFRSWSREERMCWQSSVSTRAPGSGVFYCLHAAASVGGGCSAFSS